MTTLFYDDILPTMAQMAVERLGAGVLQDNVFLRDPSGRLSLILLDNAYDESDIRKLRRDMESRFSPYVDTDGFVIATPEELFDDELTIDSALDVEIWAQGSSLVVKLIDRRIMGEDWLQQPAENAATPRIVFSSLKGGVGRSTALCVAASALAKHGQRVLAIDMDVEAPGLGSMLLHPDTMPRLGLLDYLVEANFGVGAAALLQDLVAPSWLSHGAGIIDVLPALGSSSFKYPENVLSKIARAYTSSLSDSSGVTARLQFLLQEIDGRSTYDVVLVDARAGLHETTGAALMGLGAHVVLFGTNQAQTFSAYRILFENLRLTDKNLLSDRLSIVHAKASLLPSEGASFATSMLDVIDQVRRTNHGEWLDSAPTEIGFEVDWETDERVLDNALADIISSSECQMRVIDIPESELFRDFDPLVNPKSLSSAIYQAVYGEFVNRIFELVDLPAPEANYD